jgi:4-amino-4-deoxy-L-arabinose transferase-like glycosyltransferase
LQSLVELGRLCAALAGGVLIFATFSLARLVLPDLPALAAAAATAVTPLITVHARILKEDIFVAAFLVLALAALIRLLRDPAPHRAVLLGILAGLAGGSKYIGQLMVLFAVAAILLVPTPGPQRRLLRAALVTAVSIGTYLLIMLPAIRRMHRWRRGMSFEFTHAMYGHDVPLPPQLTYGLFHLRESLWPGLGGPLLVLGLIGLAAPLIAPPERRMPLWLIVSFSTLWYVVHEASPLKPYPDFAHYMLPLAPLLVILATSFIYELLSRRDRLGIAAAIVIALAAIPALWTSVRTNVPDLDPRAVVPPILTATGARVVTDRYADYDTSRKLLGIVSRPTESTADIVATANLTYDRFTSDAAYKDPLSQPAAAYYDRLAALPHLDVSNGRPTMAYFNPVIGIVAMDGSVERLKQIAAAIEAAAPGFKVQLIERRPAN